MRFGAEDFDSEEYSMEGLDIGAFFKKMWAGIISAFRKLGQMIANFTRSMMNAVGSTMLKGQKEWYTKNKSEIATKFKSRSKETIKVKVFLSGGKQDIDNAANAVTTAMGGYSKLAQKTLARTQKLADDASKEIKNEKGALFFKSKIKGLKVENKSDMKSISKIMLLGNSKLMTAFETKFTESGKLPSAGIAAECAVYKDATATKKATPTTIAINKFCSVKSFDVLATEPAIIKGLHKVVKIGLADSNYAIKSAQKISKVIDSMTKSAASGSNAAVTRETNNYAAGSINKLRGSSSYITGIAIQLFSMTLRYRANLMTAAKIIIKNSNKDKDKKDDDNK